jgi:hypothetical protein
MIAPPVAPSARAATIAITVFGIRMAPPSVNLPEVYQTQAEPAPADSRSARDVTGGPEGCDVRSQRKRIWLVALAIAVTLATSSCNYDWTGFQYDGGHSNATPDTGISTANVGMLTQVWSANLGEVLQAEPLVYQGVVYAAGSSGVLMAFDAAGIKGCSGTPTVCEPLWSADVGHGQISNTPAIVDGQVVVMTQDGYLAAYDAAGVNGCVAGATGTTTCTPLWSYTNPVRAAGSFQVADGYIFTEGAYGAQSFGAYTQPGSLAVFDAAGVDGCTGTPKTCSPLWTGTTELNSLSPAVAGDTVYAVDTSGNIVTFPTDPSTCAGTPAVCSSQRTYSVYETPGGSPSVVGGDLYVATYGNGLLAFDATGATNCGAGTSTCTSSWTALPGDMLVGSPTVSGGRVLIGDIGPGQPGLDVLDAHGAQGCSGTPTTCLPEWVSDPALGDATYTSVDNGVAFAAMSDELAAYDLTGTTDCSGVLVTCEPLWSTPGQFRRTVESHGRVFAATTDGHLDVFQPTA